MDLRTQVLVLRVLNVLLYKAIYPDAPHGNKQTEKRWQDLSMAVAHEISFLEGKEGGARR